MRLGVNVDHIAVLKAARGVNDPDVLQALWLAAQGGADQITIHLREDRRHIDDYDAGRIVQNSPLPVNMECALDPQVLDLVCELSPRRATLVPEKREEVTTEGGLALARNFDRIAAASRQLKAAEVAVSLFIEPDEQAIALSAKAGADMVEFHTGHYANCFAMLEGGLERTPYAIEALRKPRAQLEEMREQALEQLKNATLYAREHNLAVAAGHGLNYLNVKPVAAIDLIEELNIGQSIVARSVFTGFKAAVEQMVALIR
jgi:pyridoxine 5-phosphate synthase